MKKFFSFFVISIMLGCSFLTLTANATFLPGYTRDSLTGLTYDSLTTGTIVNAVQSGTADDGNIYINLPFTFNYNGVNYSRVTACTNGWVGMDSNTSTSFSAGNLFTSTAPNNIAGGFFRDANLNTAFGGIFKHGQIIVGSDTIYAIEYRNFSAASGGGTSGTAQVNFQVWLYKTSNKIVFKYGALLGTVGAVASLGIEDDETGTAPHFYNALTNNTTSTTTTTVWPGNGNGYRYTPIPVVPNDVGATANIAPTGTYGIGSPTIAPKATFRNFGTNNQLTPFNVTYKITGAKNWTSTKTDTITAGLTNNVTFDSTFVPDSTGVCNVTIYTSLASDVNHANDTLKTSFTIQGHDVGTTVILNPVPGISGGSVFPAATIKNFSLFNETTPFNVTCTVSPGGYSNTIAVDTLLANASKNVTFSSSVSLTAGVTYTVTVYTSLAGDVNRTNDTQRVTVTPIFPNYGNQNGYFFANSLAIDQPSYPTYCWKDTTGSANVLLNGVTQPGNTLVGTLDDGYFILSLKSILSSMGQDTTNKHLKYNGVCYDSIFPGSNGIIGFTQQYGTTSLTSFNIDGDLVADNALLPLWHDFNLGTLTFNLQNRISYKVSRNQLIITYDKVACFAPTTDWASFQVVIDIVTGCAAPNSNFRYTYADTTTGQTSGLFVSDYIAQYPAVTGTLTTFRNYVVGYSYTSAPNVFGGFVSSANPFPATPQTQLNYKRPIYDLTSYRGLAVEFGPNINSLSEQNCLNSMLTVKVAFQGFQNAPIASQRRVRDTVEILIREGSAAPYAILARYKVLLDSGFSGYAFGYKNLPDAILKQIPHYIEIRQRNTVPVWSNLINPVSDTTVYDFTTGVNKTYGNNSILTNGVASMYSGDVAAPVIEVQDGCVTLTDVLKISNDASVFTSGSYVLTDINYDGITDLTDVVISYNNNTNFVCKVQPPGALDLTDYPVINLTNVNNSNTPVIYLPDPNFKDKSEFNNEINTKIKEEKK